MSGLVQVRRDRGREFQILGAATLKLREPNDHRVMLANVTATRRARRESRILQGRVYNPSERGTATPIILTHVTGTKQFFGLRRNSRRQAVVRHLELCQIPY